MTSLTIYIFCLGILVFITAAIAYQSFFEHQRPGARTFGFLMTAMTIWSGAYLLETLLPDFSEKVIARKIVQFGMVMSPAFWLAFALRYTRYGDWWGQYGRNALLAIPGVIAFLLGATNERHHLIWRSLEMVAPLSPLQATYGILFWVYTGISYFFIALGFSIHLMTHIRAPQQFRWQTSMTLLGAFATLTSNAVFLTGVFPAHVDPTPLSFALSAPLFAIGFFRFGVFNLFPVAAPLIVENLRDAVIVADENDRITNINRAAKQWFNMSEESIGALIFDILPQPELFKDKWNAIDASVKFKIENGEQRTWYDAAVIRLHKNDQTLQGRIVIFHDMTEELELLEVEMRHSMQMGLLEESGRHIAESRTEREILQHSVDDIVNHFGYAEAAVSLLTRENELEVFAIAGAQDYGYRPSFKQRVGEGVIGHAAYLRQTYIAPEVSKDPYYFSSEARGGSALGIPLINEQNLLGVLYVESARPQAFDNDDVQTLETLANQVASAMQRARLYASTQEHVRILSAVQSISQVISSTLELEKIYASVIKVLNFSFGYAYISIYLLEDDEHLRLGAQIGYTANPLLEVIHVSQGICGRTIQIKKTQFIQDVSADPAFISDAPEVTCEICVPLLKENSILGVINVEGTANAPLTQKDADMLNILAGPIALAVDNARLHAQVKTAATVDAVTGLYNRYVFEDALQAEEERATRTKTPFSLVIFDLDSFKDYNDTWGHPAGDKRLRATADLICNNLRKYDIAARYGGDEFAVILPNTNRKEAFLFVKRLLAAARASAPTADATDHYIAGYTLSIGFATFPYDGDTVENLLLVADHAALIAKRLGKNRIVSAQEVAL